MAKKANSSEQSPKKPRHHPEKGLTGIPQRIHCPSTLDGGALTDDFDELDEIAIDQFLDTLVAVAFAVASRRKATDQQGGNIA